MIFLNTHFEAKYRRGSIGTIIIVIIIMLIGTVSYGAPFLTNEGQEQVINCILNEESFISDQD